MFTRSSARTGVLSGLPACVPKRVRGQVEDPRKCPARRSSRIKAASLFADPLSRISGLAFFHRPLEVAYYAEQWGHSTITTTMDLYSHVTETMQVEAAEKLDVVHQSAKRRRDSQA